MSMVPTSMLTWFLPCRIAREHGFAGNSALRLSIPQGCIYADLMGDLDIARILPTAFPLQALAYSSSAGPTFFPRVSSSPNTQSIYMRSSYA